MEDSRRLATVNGYQGLVAAIRARKDEMRISDTELEELAQLTRGHVSKLLAAGATKTLGPLSMGRLLRALGLELIVAENAEQTAKVRELYALRNDNQVRKRQVIAMAMIDRPPWLFDCKRASEMGKKRWSGVSKARRLQIVRKSARTRRLRKLQRARLASVP